MASEEQNLVLCLATVKETLRWSLKNLFIGLFPKSIASYEHYWNVNYHWMRICKIIEGHSGSKIWFIHLSAIHSLNYYVILVCEYACPCPTRDAISATVTWRFFHHILCVNINYFRLPRNYIIHAGSAVKFICQLRTKWRGLLLQ